jgi:hypothetical protein
MQSLLSLKDFTAFNSFLVVLDMEDWLSNMKHRHNLKQDLLEKPKLVQHAYKQGHVRIMPLSGHYRVTHLSSQPTPYSLKY